MISATKPANECPHATTTEKKMAKKMMKASKSGMNGSSSGCEAQEDLGFVEGQEQG